MKKTRFLATLLCLMMVVCSLPMVSVSAAVSDSLYDQIGGLMGRASSRPVDNATWLSMNFDFTDNFSQTDSITLPEGASYDNTNGLNMPKETYSTWNYFPSTLTSQGWSPLVFGAYTTRVKIDEGGKLDIIACAYYNHARSFITVSQTGVTVYSSSDNETIGVGQSVVTNTNDYVPGSDWNDVVVVANGGSASSANGYSVYMKKDTDTEFTLVCSTASYRGNGAWTSTGLTIAGNDAYVAHAVMLEGSDTKLVEEVPTGIPYDAVGKVLGYETSVAHPGTSDWSGMDLEFTGSFDASAVTGLTVPTGVTFDSAKGAIFPSGDLVVMTYFVPGYENKWTPMAHGNFGLRFKLNAGGSINLQAAQLWGSVGRIFVDITETGTTIYDGGESGTGQGVVEKLVDYKVGNEWTDILFTSNSAGGYDTYMKEASETAFTKVASTTSYRSGGNMNGGGTQIAAQNAYVPYAKCFQASGDAIEVVTGIPEVTAADLVTAGQAIGEAGLAASTSYTFDFVGAGEGYVQPDAVKTDIAGFSYGEDGLDFGSTVSAWRYLPSAAWSPFNYGGVTYFKGRTSVGGMIEAQMYCNTGVHSRAFFIIKPDGISAPGAASVTWHVENFTPGNGWVEYMVQVDGSQNLMLWAKGGNYENWTKLLTIAKADWRTGSNQSGISFAGNNAYVSYVTLGSLLPSEYASIEEIMGGPVAATYAFDFDSDFDATNWSRSGNGALNSPEGITYSDENGLDMTTLDAAANWNFYPYSGWSPLSQNPAWGTFEQQAVYIKLKGTVNVQLRGPGNSGRFYQDFKANGTIGAGGATAAKNYGLSSDDGWMEYLIVPNEAGKDAGFAIYIKGETATSGKWQKALVTSNYRSGGGNTTGISLYGNGGYVKSIRTFVPAVADANTLPTGANVEWYHDDMSTDKEYINVDDANVVYEDGYANFPATAEGGSIAYKLFNGAIPVGGYAEFKTRSNGHQSFNFNDGTTAVSITLFKDYGDVTDGYGYVADGSNTWRTYRIVRSAEGYSVYSKVDTDSAWVKQAVNVSKASTSAPGIELRFQMHQNGTNVGSGQVDYLKVYGPAPEAEFVMTDGISTKVLEGTEMTYKNTRALVKQGADARMIFFAEYSDDVLVSLKAEEVEAGEGVVSVPYSVKNTANDVKVFLWDDYAKLTNLEDAVEFTIQ